MRRIPSTGDVLPRAPRNVHPRVVEIQVEPPEALRDRYERPVDGRRVGYIGHERDNLPEADLAGALAAVAFKAVAVRPATTTVQPSPASACATTQPIPPPPRVTGAMLSISFLTYTLL